MAQQVGDVLLEQVTLLHELERHGGAFTDVFVAIAITLLNRRARIPGAFAFGFSARERNIGTDLAGQAFGRTNGGVAVVPAGVRRERHRGLAQPDAPPVVARRVNGTRAGPGPP